MTRHCTQDIPCPRAEYLAGAISTSCYKLCAIRRETAAPHLIVHFKYERKLEKRVREEVSRRVRTSIHLSLTSIHDVVPLTYALSASASSATSPC
jgi:hypothetical protein